MLGNYFSRWHFEVFFLFFPENKIWDFMQIFSLRDSNIVIVTKEEGAVSNYQSLEGMAPCNHEEADSCIFVHARHAVAEGYIPLMIKASDTDVLVNAISVFPVLKDLGLENLWLAFGQEANLPGFQYMTSVTLLALRSQKDFPSFMHSLVVMLFQLFLEKVKRLHGKHGCISWCLRNIHKS